MKAVSFIEPPQADVIEEILNGHQSGAMVGGLWQARAARGPPEVDHLVLELDASYMDSSIDSQDQAEPPELTYIHSTRSWSCLLYTSPSPRDRG